MQTVLKVTADPDKGLYYRHRRRYLPLKAAELEIEIGNYGDTTRIETLRQYRNGENLLIYGGHGKVTKGLDQPLEFVVLKRLDSDRVALDVPPMGKRKT